MEASFVAKKAASLEKDQRLRDARAALPGVDPDQGHGRGWMLASHRQPTEEAMKARDVMASPVITVKPSDSVRTVAELFLKYRISAVPVVDNDDRVVGMVSEADLLHRAEAGTERRRSWWLSAFLQGDTLAQDYIKAHAGRVEDVMTRDVIVVRPYTPVHEVATLLEKNGIKRVPVVEDERLVGIVSRANLIQAVASARKELDVPLSDAAIRDNLLAHLKRQPWANTALLNITVTGGVVDLWGATETDAERHAIRVAAEAAKGVTAVNDNLVTRPVHGWM
jgi:CBS domain-containing protein